ncbi:9209_t:CDS:2 [Funneliformis mosseae]|uniref:9209_t:CDS:1 n=1 Tax=Funneliformis mosseae TaxID=27381 RepID=A0A9N9A670_FUNMO|nr:9209_t:CDS:2 [Funneliformis mosseae]
MSSVNLFITVTLKLEAIIVEVGRDENGDFIIFDKTIFHPQGGGQPDDKGHFKLKNKQFVVKKLWAPRNFNEEEPFNMEEQVNQMVLQEIDMKLRKFYAHIHSAGHLLSNAVNNLYPNIDGCNGNHFPETSFVIFEGSPLPELQELKQKLSEKVNELVKSNLPVKIVWESKSKTIQFGSFKAYPCGGTHVANTLEIGEITIRKLKKEKGGKLKVGYDIK